MSFGLAAAPDIKNEFCGFSFTDSCRTAFETSTCKIGRPMYYVLLAIPAITFKLNPCNWSFHLKESL